MLLLCCRLYRSDGLGRPFGPKCTKGDKLGCRVLFDQIKHDDLGVGASTAPVAFTKNGKEVYL